MGMTFYNGRNYRGAVKRGDQAWYSYDGLWERNGPGTGLQKGLLTTPAGYISPPAASTSTRNSS